MMSMKSFVRGAGALVFMGWSSFCLAGGHGGRALVFHVGGHGAGRLSVSGGQRGWGGSRVSRAAVPRFAGFGYAQRAAIYGARFGHTNTAYLGQRGRFAGAGAFAPGQRHSGGFGWRGLGYGRRGLARYAFAPRGLDRARRILPGFVGPGFYPYDESSYASGSAYGYAEPPLGATYAEPPLGPSPYGSNDGLSFDDRDTGFGASAGYGGGPRIISVRAGDRPRQEACYCRRDAAQGPVVYRFGVGSYY